MFQLDRFLHCTAGGWHFHNIAVNFSGDDLGASQLEQKTSMHWT